MGARYIGLWMAAEVVALGHTGVHRRHVFVWVLACCCWFREKIECTRAKQQYQMCPSCCFCLKGWLAAHSGAVGVKQVDKRAKRSAPVAVAAETAAVTSFNNSSSSGYVKRTQVERTPQRTDGAVTAHRGGARPAFNAEARPTTAGHSQRQHVHQQHRGRPAAAKTTAPHGRHV